MCVAQSFGMSVNAQNRVCNISQSGLAYSAGVRIGDLLLAFNGQDVAGEDALFGAMRALDDGASVEFKVQRAGQPVPEGNAV